MSPLVLAIPSRCLADMGHSRPKWAVHGLPPVSDRTADIAGGRFRAMSRHGAAPYVAKRKAARRRFLSVLVAREVGPQCERSFARRAFEFVI
jgi:hypothetical protein